MIAVDPGAFVTELAGTEIGGTFNQYANGPRAALLRERLGDYLEARADAFYLLVGEAPGYRGARVSGIPFASERQLTGAGPAEATATIVRRVLAELELESRVLCWNVVPTHPGTSSSNRPPSSAEVHSGLPFTAALASGREVIAVGRVAAAALGVPGLRHPSHGGAAAFREGLMLAVGSARRAENAAPSDPLVVSRDTRLGPAAGSPTLLSSAAGDQTIAFLSEQR